MTPAKEAAMGGARFPNGHLGALLVVSATAATAACARTTAPPVTAVPVVPAASAASAATQPGGACVMTDDDAYEPKDSELGLSARTVLGTAAYLARPLRLNNSGPPTPAPRPPPAPPAPR